MIDARQHYLARYQSVRQRLENFGSGPLRRLRRSAIERLADVGFPNSKTEEWKFTPLAALLAQPFEPAVLHPGDTEALQRILAGFDGVRLVFVDGRFEASASDLGGLSGGVIATNLARCFEDGEGLISHLGQHALFKTSSFTALNTALMEDGAVLYVPSEIVLEEPIQLIFVASAPRAISNPRILIVVGAGASATVVESYLGGCPEPYFTNVVTEAVLERGARLEHLRLQQEADQGFHVGLLQVSQGQGSRLSSHAFSLGGSLARTEIRTVLAEEGSSCALNGLYMGRASQHQDNFTSIDHAATHCTSRELYKGVLDEKSSGVFSGRIRVHPDAQKTDASQTNKNLLLSEDAVVDTKPQLEIFADDVKCTHGAAVGQLDDDAIFYLRSRGMAKEDARRLLTYAFARELVELVPPSVLKCRIERLVTAKLPAGAALAEAA
ncbi:MAG TPA: Fe-S cluster assembly protein SufD [Myxococcaceae bacterium]|nr:Fe-S cluster assembly protein SufD [Myxococcaceae bacterium]